MKKIAKMLIIPLLGVSISACNLTNLSSSITSGIVSSSNLSNTSSEIKINKSSVELIVDEKYSDDVVATVFGVNSQVSLSSDGIIYSIDFYQDETIEITAKSSTGKYNYYFNVNKTVYEVSANEDLYLDENGKGTLVLDCDSVVLTLVGELNEDWNNSNSKEQILAYYEELNELFGFKGEYLEILYGWIVDASDFENAQLAATYVEDNLPSDFSLSSDESEDENNIWYVYVDSTETYRIDVAMYQDGEEIVGEIELSYVEGNLVPNPNGDGNSLSKSEQIIKDISKNINPDNEPTLDVDYFSHLNGEPDWFYLEYSGNFDSLEAAVNDGISFMPEYVDVLPGEEYYEYLDEGYGYIWYVDDELSVIVDISAFVTETEGYYQVVITTFPAGGY